MNKWRAVVSSSSWFGLVVIGHISRVELRRAQLVLPGFMTFSGSTILGFIQFG